VQIGTPEDIYYRPDVPFVADFVGSSNILPPALTGLSGLAAIRPEALRIAPGGLTPATVTAVSFLGSATRVGLLAGDTCLTALLPKEAARPAVGDHVTLAWDGADLHLMQGAPR
jgi:putative spermidine/putrescine transport system ATP-binding protein